MGLLISGPHKGGASAPLTHPSLVYPRQMTRPVFPSKLWGATDVSSLVFPVLIPPYQSWSVGEDRGCGDPGVTSLVCLFLCMRG